MRRISGVLLAATALFSAALATPGHHLPPAQAADLTSFQATPADSVVDAYGVGIHLAFLDTPYADATRVADALSDLGVRHVRDDLYLDNPRQYDGIGTVASRGIGFDLIMGRPDRPGTPEDYVTTAAALPAGSLDSLEGVNEWDLFSGGSADWPTQLLTWQQRLYAAAKANPATADLPVLAPALAFRWNYPTLAAAGDIDPYADEANAHMYPGGYKPSTEVTNITNAIRALIPSKPLVTTETGYHNAMNTTNGHHPVPEDVAGTYYPRLLLEHYLHGDKRTYSYELIDEFDDSGLTNPEANFGLLHRDWTPKPAYTAMKNLLGLLSDPGPSFTPDSLLLRADGWPSDGRYLLTEKRDGEFVLLMWRDASVYDPVLQQRTPVTPANVTLQLSKNYQLGVYQPSSSSAPVSQTRGSSLPLQIGPDVTAVTIDPSPAPAPTSVTATPGNASATVSWQLPSTAAPVSGFEVVRSPGGVVTTLDPSARSFKDTGLVNGSSYSWTVRTLSSDGDSAAVTSPTVVPATVPGAPVITSTSGGKGSVTVAWRAPSGNGRPILGYQLVSGTKSLSVGPSTLKATLTGLKGSVQVAVRARNEIGWGPYAYTPYVKARHRHR